MGRLSAMARTVVGVVAAWTFGGLPSTHATHFPVNCTVDTPVCSEKACASPSAHCWHPNATQCHGDYCCLSCTRWRKYMEPAVPTCGCDEYKSGECFASDCVPCSQDCFTHNQSGLPLGLGILCTNSSAQCEPCCQHKHAAAFCHLRCPCDGGGSDCPPYSLTLLSRGMRET